VSVDSIAEKTNDFELAVVNPHTTKLSLTLFCVVLLLPAWKWYILPFYIEQGWDPIFPMKTTFENIKKLVEDIETQEGLLDEAQIEEKEEKLKVIQRLAQIVHEHATTGADKAAVKKFERKATLAGELESAEYKQLAEDGMDALAKENTALKSELAKEKSRIHDLISICRENSNKRA